MIEVKEDRVADEIISSPMMRMEEEEDSGEESVEIGFTSSPAAARDRTERGESTSTTPRELIGRLVDERQRIMADTSLKISDKIKLLESNHRAMLMIRGGTFKSFKTEQVVYAILIFNAVMLVTLALLNVYGKLPAEVTLAFVGTALGGTIATIAQKLGRL